MSKIAPVPAPTPAWPAMSKEERAAWLRENGKGYLSEKEQEEELRLCYGKIESVSLAEARKANEAKNNKNFWEWYSLTAAPAHSLMTLKKWNGAEFLRSLDFDISKANEAYGPGWLEE